MLFRRDFLRRGIAAALWAAGAARLERLAASLPVVEAGLTSQRALRRLAANLTGRLVVSSSRAYPAARRLFNTRFDGVLPLAVAYCAHSRDVQTCLRWAQEERVPIAARNGGHSAAGYSTTRGLMIDVSRMNTIAADAQARRARIGAGAVLGEIYPALVQRGLTVPGGTCPGVGISGLTLGGGVGYLTNLLGTTSDNLLSLDIVTADGRLLHCDERLHPELFWASRGGGGGNFGIVTALTLRAHQVHRATYATFEWDLRDAPGVIDAWQRWAPEAGDRLTSTCEASTAGGPPPARPPVLTVSLQFDGPEHDLEQTLAPFLAASGARPRRRIVRDAPYAEVISFWLAREAPASRRATVKNKTAFLRRPLPADGIRALIRALEARQANERLTAGGGFWMQALGGRYARVGQGATAYVHRDARVLVQYLTTWAPADPTHIVQENFRWIDTLYAAMRPFGSGEAYQNFMDPDLPAWPRAYYGDNLDRLVRIKREADPANVFRFAQGIPART